MIVCFMHKGKVRKGKGKSWVTRYSAGRAYINFMMDQGEDGVIATMLVIMSGW
jgi:hypothetical protein